MFRAFDVRENLKIIDEKSLIASDVYSDKTRKSASQQTLLDFQEMFVDDKSRLGTVTRSRFGCNECRRRKKRCDETKPTCGTCRKAEVECTWREPGTERKNKRRKNCSLKKKVDNIPHSTPNVRIEQKTPITEVIEIDPPSNCLETNSMVQTATLSSQGEKQLVSLVAANSSTEINELEYSPSEFLNIDDDTVANDFLLSSLKDSPFHAISHTNMKFSPMKSVSSGFIVGLTEFEINYLDYYTNHVANTVSILPKESNYFLSFYIPLAAQDKSVLYALFAWTDLFLSGNKSEGLHNRYLNKSIELLETKIESGCISSTDRLSSISVLTILCAAEICAGDVKDWYKYFRKLHKLIIDQSCGDIPGFLQRFFGNSNEAKWLMSNFLYHDVLSSLSYENGTFFKMEEYCQVLDIEWKRDPQTGGEISKIMDTGVVSDPLQGCVRPLYLLIGQITNSFVELERLAENIKMQEINDSDYTKLTNQKFDYYSTINDTFSELDFQINNSSPHTPALYYLNTDKELELHLTLFEAYRLSISIYLRNLIRKVPPASPEIQLLFIELVKCLDIVMGSNVQASLCFPLLLAGVSAVFSNDRNMIEQKLKTMCEEFPVKNFKRVLTIIKKTWQLNEEGRKCIYWFDITKELGWDLCLA